VIRALAIDAKAGEVREMELPDREGARLAALNAAIGGFLELAHMWPTGDALFVDEDGLRHDWPFGFVLHAAPGTFPRSFVGCGIVVGREVEGDQYPDGWTNLDAAITADELRAIVRFLRRDS
jgi:hypothetical protein